MNNDKVTITDKLRLDIIEQRKNTGMSSYMVSEASGHSKFWLQNIESGKTKNIQKSDLLSIYATLYGENYEYDDLIEHLEKILNQQVGTQPKKWYELINISDDFAKENDMSTLLENLRRFFYRDIYREMVNRVSGMSIDQAQAALTAVQTFYYSLYANPDLAFALMSIPLYGIERGNTIENEAALNDILAMSAKYDDIAIKHNSIEIVKSWQERDKRYLETNERNIKETCKIFNDMLNLITNVAYTPDPPLRYILDVFYSTIIFPIDDIYPGSLGNDIPSLNEIHTGSDFACVVQICSKWFYKHEDYYDLAALNNKISNHTLTTAIDFLNTVKEIPPRAQNHTSTKNS